MGVSPGKTWISKVSEKQSEALLRLFSQTIFSKEDSLLILLQAILKENWPFFIFSYDIFHPS